MHFEQFPHDKDTPTEVFLQKENIYNDVVTEDFIRAIERLSLNGPNNEPETYIRVLKKPVKKTKAIKANGPIA